MSVSASFVPNARLHVDANGYPVVAWDGLTDAAAPALGDPRIVIKYGIWLGGFLGCGPGTLRIPLPRATPLWGDGAVRLCLIGRVSRTLWKRSKGAETGSVSVVQEAIVPGLDGQQRIYAEGESPASAFWLSYCLDAFSLGRDDGTVVPNPD